MVDKEKILLPEGFEDMVRGVIGDSEWDAFVEALADEPSVSIRVNGQRSMVNGQCFNPSVLRTAPLRQESNIEDNRLQITDSTSFLTPHSSLLNGVNMDVICLSDLSLRMILRFMLGHIMCKRHRRCFCGKH